MFLNRQKYNVSHIVFPHFAPFFRNASPHGDLETFLIYHVLYCNLFYVCGKFQSNRPKILWGGGAPMASPANYKIQSYVPYHSMSITTGTCSQLHHRFSYNTILPFFYCGYCWNISDITGCEVVLYEKCDAIVSTCI